MSRPCYFCKNEIPQKKLNYKRVKYCSNNCRKAHERGIYRSLNSKDIKNPTATVGAIQELIVSADLLRRGHEVFRSLSAACSCDLAILKDNKLLRVEVTTGYYSISKKISFPKHTISNYDILAVVTNDNKIHYAPPF